MRLKKLASMTIIDFIMQLYILFSIWGQLSASKSEPISQNLKMGSINDTDTAIYLIGGRNGADFSGVVYRLVPETGDIRELSIDSQYRGWMDAVSLNNATALFYTYPGSPNYNGYAIYDPRNQTTKPVHTIPNVELNDPSAVILGPLFINCGQVNNMSTCLVYNFDDKSHNTITINEHKRAGCVVDYDDRQHILWIGGDTSYSVLKINYLDGSYKQVATLSKPRYAHSCLKFPDFVLICGGVTDKSISTCTTLRLPDMKWSHFSPMKSGRLYFSLIKRKDKIFAVGDYLGEQRVEVYHNESWEYTGYSLPKILEGFGVAIIHDNFPAEITRNQNQSSWWNKWWFFGLVGLGTLLMVISTIVFIKFNRKMRRVQDQTCEVQPLQLQNVYGRWVATSSNDDIETVPELPPIWTMPTFPPILENSNPQNSDGTPAMDCSSEHSSGIYEEIEDDNLAIRNENAQITEYF